MPTGFFDLSLELRQQIYRESLPWSACNGYYTELNEHDQLQPLRAVDPRVALELQDEERMNIRTLSFVVTTTEWTPPPEPVAYPNVKALDIDYKFPTYDKSEHDENCLLPNWRRGCKHCKEQFATMQENLRRLIAWFMQANDKPLEDLLVGYYGAVAALRTNHDDPYGQHFAITLRTLYSVDPKAAKDEPDTVLEYLLLPLQTLPSVSCASIWKVEHLSPYWKFAGVFCGGHYDREYMVIVTTTLEEWLEGDRVSTIEELLKPKLELHRWECEEEDRPYEEPGMGGSEMDWWEMEERREERGRELFGSAGSSLDEWYDDSAPVEAEAAVGSDKDRDEATKKKYHGTSVVDWLADVFGGLQANLT